MATNAKGADLIGKTIVVVNNDKIKYFIKSVEGDKLMTDFCMEGREPMPCPVPMEQLTKMVDAGTWSIAEGEATDVKPETVKPETSEEPTATADEVEEVVDEPIEEPAAETVRIKTEMPKDKAEEKGTAKPKVKPVGGSRGQAPDSSQATHQGASPHDAGKRKLTYSTYTTKRGKTGAKIVGFNETDAAYLAGPDLHGSKAWETDKQGNKQFCLLFSHRYAKAAKDVCEALNKGKSVSDCQAIIDGCTEERAQRREEWRARRDARDNATTNEGEATATTEKLYTETEVRKAFATLADASGVDVKEFEPIIEAMKAAA